MYVCYMLIKDVIIIIIIIIITVVKHSLLSNPELGSFQIPDTSLEVVGKYARSCRKISLVKHWLHDDTT